jgi:CRISPR system Cascade subunit CasD
MSDLAYLALVLDGPLQSWGFASRFERRTTGIHPTKSGIAGMICAAAGVPKGSDGERTLLGSLRNTAMLTIAIPRTAGRDGKELPILRLEDYHTVLGTRRARGAPNEDAVITRRQYLTDARFGVVLEGVRRVLERVAQALADPVWGLWLGRKSCIPAQPIARGLFDTKEQALRALIGDRQIEEFTTVADVTEFSECTDSLNDQPLTFGDGSSSGPDQRRFSLRRLTLTPAVGRSS